MHSIFSTSPPRPVNSVDFVVCGKVVRPYGLWYSDSIVGSTRYMYLKTRQRASGRARLKSFHVNYPHCKQVFFITLQATRSFATSRRCWKPTNKKAYSHIASIFIANSMTQPKLQGGGGGALSSQHYSLTVETMRPKGGNRVMVPSLSPKTLALLSLLKPYA